MHDKLLITSLMASLLTVLRCPCTAEFIKADLVTFMHQLIYEFIKAELVTFMHQDTGHAWMNGRYKKVDLHHKWIVRTSSGLLFSTPALTGKKVFQSEKFACSDTAKRAARSMTGLTLLYYNFIQSNNYGTFIMEQNWKRHHEKGWRHRQSLKKFLVYWSRP